jgi:hypothetical protein
MTRLSGNPEIRAVTGELASAFLTRRFPATVQITVAADVDGQEGRATSGNGGLMPPFPVEVPLATDY